MSRVRSAQAWTRSHQLPADAALAAVLLGLALLSSQVTSELLQAVDPSFRAASRAGVVVGLIATMAPLALRRRTPLAALLACTAGFVVSRVALDSIEASITSIALSLAFYSAAAHGSQRWRSWACAVSLFAGMAELAWEVRADPLAVAPNEWLFESLAIGVNLALLSSMWALGATVGSGRRLARDLLDRTAALEHEREDRALRAVFDERVRIARELHDVVAHHVSIMGVQAGAARMVMERDPAKATGALASIEESSRQAVAELNRLLSFLRLEGDPDEVGPQPGLRQLSDLATQLGGAELAVEVRVEGEARPLPATIEVSAYRIVQEALTNALKHSGASTARVHLRYRPGEVEVEIVDDGHGTATAPTGGAGLGLIGMRERASLYGGRLAAGPVPGGGFAVLATFPVNGVAP